jgi:MtaA/CmuA family methyltransferase
MNACQRLTARLAGQPVDRPPNLDILMTFAARAIGQPLRAYHLDHRVLVDANLAMVDAYGIDIVQTISDPYREACDMGLHVEFPEDNLPVAAEPLLREPADLARLPSPSPASGARMSDRLSATRLLRERVGGEVPIMGWVEGALAEAADLRGVGALLVDLYDRPDWVEALLEHCTAVAIAFARAQIEAGAEIIGLGDAIASQMAPRAYRRFALPYEQRIFSLVHELGALARLHICGDTSRILGDMAQSGADIIDLDWMVDMEAAATVFAAKAAPCGNFDPVAVMRDSAPEAVYRATIDCLQRGGPRSLSNAGCEIPIGTPPANLLAQARALRDYGAQNAIVPQE